MRPQRFKVIQSSFIIKFYKLVCLLPPSSSLWLFRTAALSCVLCMFLFQVVKYFEFYKLLYKLLKKKNIYLLHSDSNSERMKKFCLEKPPFLFIFFVCHNLPLFKIRFCIFPKPKTWQRHDGGVPIDTVSCKQSPMHQIQCLTQIKLI